MTGDVVDINGTRLYVETHGDPTTPAVMYVHGGPGQGCYHFMHAQAQRLSRELFVIGLDLRGAMRSDPLPPHPPLSVELLVEDLEAVRAHLGLPDWALIGQSAGAPITLTYALHHPDRVRGVVFDCPALDADIVDRSRLPIAADLLDDMGKPEVAARARQLATRPERLSPITREVLAELGERRSELSFYDAATAAASERVEAESGLPEEIWDRGLSHEPLVADLYTPRLHLLAQLTVPVLLVRGVDDPVTPPSVVAAFRAASRCRGVAQIDAARHVPSFEQPAAYAAAVTDFVVGLSG